MTYLTIMLVTILSGPMEGESFVIPYNSEEACRASQKTISDTLDYDHNMLCAVTETQTNAD